MAAEQQMCCLRVAGMIYYPFMNADRNSLICRLLLSLIGICGCSQGFRQATDGVIWTEGYSIENDLYAGADLENLLESDEKAEYQQVLDSIVEWFAFEVEEYLAGRPFEVAHHCDRIVDRGKIQMDERFRQSRGFRTPGEEIHQQIRNAYRLQLRGKQLFQILERVLNARNRGTRYNIYSLHEIAVKLTESHTLMSRLIQEDRANDCGT